MRQLCMFWMAGAIIVITSAGSYSALIAGRFIMGMGIGQVSIVGPTYLAEVASARHRELLVGIFSASEYIGVVLGYFAGYGASIRQSDSSSQQWILPQASHTILAGLLLLISLGCVDSPRYLCKVKHHTSMLLPIWLTRDGKASLLRGISCSFGLSIGHG
ncbi:hypothetical protein BJX63DRAFT_394266 [Aspergillus granulosus]|uniref:Major facilitator superfamily (MFS) profile domain-containing protein n=1 Tax=Aspergillus granulosus TaxID=176169 RepID=A0ABR4HD13_9EURO